MKNYYFFALRPLYSASNKFIHIDSLFKMISCPLLNTFSIAEIFMCSKEWPGPLKCWPSTFFSFSLTEFLWLIFWNCWCTTRCHSLLQDYVTGCRDILSFSIFKMHFSMTSIHKFRLEYKLYEFVTMTVEDILGLQ